MRVTYFGENRSKMYNLSQVFFNRQFFFYSVHLYKLQSRNDQIMFWNTSPRILVLKLPKLNNLPRIVIGAFSGSPGDSLPKGAKFYWNDQKQMRWEKVALKKFKATDRFKCPVYLARLRERVIGLCFVHNSTATT